MNSGGVPGSGQEAKAGRKNNVIPWPRRQDSVFEQHARNLDRVASISLKLHGILAGVADDLRRISNADHRSTLQSTMALATAVEQATGESNGRALPQRGRRSRATLPAE
jgi:hypothetical protein